MLQEGIIHKIEKSRDSDQGGEVFSNTMAAEESYSYNRKHQVFICYNMTIWSAAMVTPYTLETASLYIHNRGVCQSKNMKVVKVYWFQLKQIEKILPNQMVKANLT